MPLSYVIALALIIALLLTATVSYNRLVSGKNLVKTAFSDIDVHLTRRFHLVPNLVQLTKNYAQYESRLLLQLTKQRSGKGNMVSQETSENDRALSRAIQELSITVENYPELKANEQFQELMEELGNIEDHLVYARRFYNGTANAYNTSVESFPHNVIARIFGFRQLPFYSISDLNERNVPVTG